MFVFLHKKIQMPNEVKIRSIAWNQVDGQICCGGDKGVLKIIQLDDSKNSKGGLSTNLNLEGHSSPINLIVWNPIYKKVTSVDESGLIIVWMQHKGQWVEEMVNNRKKSEVSDIKWSTDGKKICIIYLDGAVIVGGVDGSRYWGKELKIQLTKIEWSPDSKIMLFASTDGKIYVYDYQGNYQKKIPVSIENAQQDNLVSLIWFEKAKMYTQDTPIGLICAYKSGKLQLMKNDQDPKPIFLDANMTIQRCRWNPQGSYFAVAGSMTQDGEHRGVVQFYNNMGQFIRKFWQQGSDNHIDISWEGSGLNMSIAIGATIFFANVKPDYKWAWIDGTLIFGYQKIDRIDFCIIFWDTKNNKKNIRQVKNLAFIQSYGEYCCIILKDSDELYQIQLCNNIGSIIDSKLININPRYITMSKTHIIVCSESEVYSWNQKPKNIDGAQRDIRKMGLEMAWFIDEIPNQENVYNREQYQPSVQQIDDPITAVTANDSCFVLTRKQGSLLKFSLPHISLEFKQSVKPKIISLALNCDSSKFSTIDQQGLLQINELTEDRNVNHSEIERKEVWSHKWSRDQPNSLVCMEKQRLVFIENDKIEEPITNNSYICDFSDMTVTCAKIEDLMKSIDGNLKAKDVIIQYSQKQLKELQDNITKMTPKNAYDEMKNSDQTKVWKIITEHALEQLDFETAEKSLIKQKNYSGVQTLQRIQIIDDQNIQKAEIYAYLNKIQEADNILKKIDRKDLQIKLKMRLGDWTNISQIIKEGTGYDEILQQTYSQLGNLNYDKKMWNKAANYFQMAKNYEGYCDALYKSEDYDQLEKAIKLIPEGNEKLFLKLAQQFELVGLCQSAVNCYERVGKIKEAVDCAVLLNNWNIAVELSERHNLPQVEGLLTQYANQLLANKQKLEAAELYRRAQRNTEAAKILSEIGQDLILCEASPIDIKKLYVLAALEVEQHKKRIFDSTMTGQAMTTQKTLDSLITSDINSSADKVLNNPWRGAEAWHFYLLMQRQLYEGQYKNALKSAIKLAEYENEIEPNKIFSLLAVAAYYAENYQYCSRAFVKLKGLVDQLSEDKKTYDSYAAKIFIRNQPLAPKNLQTFPCPGKTCKSTVDEFEINCKDCGSNFPSCVASGVPIVNKEYYSCKYCKHKMMLNEITNLNLKHCAMCHQKIVPNKEKNK